MATPKEVRDHLGMAKQRWHLRAVAVGGKKRTAPNPTDRAKPGMKDHVLVDGRGMPLSLVVTAANVNDHIALPELLNNHPVVRTRSGQTS